MPTILGVLGVVAGVGLWELSVRLGWVDPVLLSPPSDVLRAVPDAFGAGELGHHIKITVIEWVCGFVLAAFVGTSLGFVAARSPRIGPLVEHWAILLLIIPMVALVPIFIVWLGIGIEMKILIAFLTAMPPITLNVLEGVRATPPELLDVARSFGAGRRLLYRGILIPASGASIIAGVRIGSGQALVGVIFAEMVASSDGVGYAIRVAGATFNTPLLLLGIVVLGVIAMLMGKFLEALQSRLEPWR